ncbi:MAG: aldo/keto reductase [Coriobacteriales bacterium]|jgi:predicted aldo/keto reductase-like oxidoreductase|nr:aldo/keto reductase [Coriobacteriales bacterium]
MDFNNYLGKDIPKLGFGLMRLPRIDGKIDIEQFQQMTDLFLQSGFTYFDTAYGYEDSEAATKIALVDRHPRASFKLATKLPAWRAETADEAKAMFYTSLERTGAGYFDYYLAHNLGALRTEYFSRFNIWEFLQERKQEGLIKHVGLSSHGKADELEVILCEHPEVEFVQLQLNYADWESHSIQCKANLEVAQAHNKPIIAMEPVKGGSLADLPQAASELLLKANPASSAASWALRYVASLNGLITILSGMSNLEQMRDNIATFTNLAPLNANEQAVIAAVQAELEKVPVVPCTSCEYCMKSCPENVAIPGIFEALNLVLRFGETRKQSAAFEYMWQTKMSHLNGAASCIACGACESACPQAIPIINELKKASNLFEK